MLPECFIPLYPSNAWGRGAAGFAGWDELWERLWANSVDVPGPLVDRLIGVCRERELFCVVGVNERESERPGTLYNTVVLIGPETRLTGLGDVLPEPAWLPGANVVSVGDLVLAAGLAWWAFYAISFGSRRRVGRPAGAETT